MEQNSACSRGIVTPRRRIKRVGAASLAVFLFLRATAVVGQQDDPSENFLKAYLSAQQGEKLERENRFKTALAKYRFAGSLIEQLRRSHANWQPAIVEYRGRKISEGILRIQERMTRQNALSASASPLPEVAPSLPESEGWSEPGPEVVALQRDVPITQASGDAAVNANLQSYIAARTAAFSNLNQFSFGVYSDIHMIESADWGNATTTLNAVPDSFWQLVQWHTALNAGSTFAE